MTLRPSELDGMNTDNERFVAKMTVLIEMVRDDVKKEERDLFPKVRAAMTRAERLVVLGTSGCMVQARRTFRSNRHSVALDPGCASSLRRSRVAVHFLLEFTLA
jgi:hypothetical protein